MKGETNTYKNWAKYMICGVFMVVVVAFLTAGANADYDLTAKEIVVQIDKSQNNRFVTEEEIINLVFKYMGGEKLDQVKKINLAHLEAVLEDEPQIQNAELYKSMMGKLNIKVMQHNPLVRLIDKNNNSVYLSEKVYTFPVSNRYTARVPIVTGNFELEDKEIINDIYALGTAINEDDFMYALTEQIIIDENKLLSIVPIVGDFIITMGQSQELEEKIVMLKAFYREGLNNGLGWDKYKAINLSFKDQVVCTKK